MADLMSLHQRVQESTAAAARDIEDALARHGSTTEALATGPMEAAGEAVGEASGARPLVFHWRYPPRSLVGRYLGLGACLLLPRPRLFFPHPQACY